MNKKAQISGLQGVVLALVVIGILLGSGLLIVANLRTEVSNNEGTVGQTSETALLVNGTTYIIQEEAVSWVSATNANQTYARLNSLIAESDDAAQRINISNPQYPTDAWAISIWWSGRTPSFLFDSFIIDNTGSAISNNLGFIMYTDDGGATATFNNGTEEMQAGDAKVDNNRPTNWKHQVVVFNTTSLIMYTDGVLNATDNDLISNVEWNNTNGISILGPIDLTCCGVTQKAINGSVDEFRLYNRSLSASEVTQLYSSGRTANSSLPSDDLWYWYSFNEGSGTNVINKVSGFGNATIISADGTQWSTNTIRKNMSDIPGTTQTLVENTDYTQNLTDFVLINSNYEFAGISTNFLVGANGTGTAALDDVANAISKIPAFLGIIALIIVVALLIVVLFTSFPRQST